MSPKPAVDALLALAYGKCKAADGRAREGIAHGHVYCMVTSCVYAIVTLPEKNTAAAAVAAQTSRLLSSKFSSRAEGACK